MHSRTLRGCAPSSSISKPVFGEIKLRWKKYNNARELWSFISWEEKKEKVPRHSSAPRNNTVRFIWAWGFLIRRAANGLCMSWQYSISRGSVQQVGKERQWCLSRKCILSCRCLFWLFYPTTLTRVCGVSRRCFHCKNSSGGHGLSVRSQVHTFVFASSSTRRTNIIFSHICISLTAKKPVNTAQHLIPAFWCCVLLLFIYFFDAQRVLESLCFAKHLSKSRTEKPRVSSCLFGGLIKASAQWWSWALLRPVLNPDKKKKF